MKKWKRTVSLALAAVFAASVVILASGNTSVVSLSYLTGPFLDQLNAVFHIKTEDMDAVYAAAEEKLAEKLGENEDYPGWTVTNISQLIYPMAGETVTLGSGSGCIWYSGTGAASATLLDVTTGEELAAGQPLEEGHRYLAEQETVITAMSESFCSAEGFFKTTATGEPSEEQPPKEPFVMSFTDVTENDWYYSAVAYVVENGLFNGTSATTFEPNTYMNRAMLVTVLHRVADTPKTDGSNAFEDVKSTDWFYPGVLWASESGVVNGVSETRFNPLGNVTREQIAVILYRYASYLGYDVSARAALDDFADGAKVSGYAQEGMSWAVAEGLFKGANGKLTPTDGATRAEVATLMQRYEEWLAAN